ncbi:MAG: DUF3868 domain-containing protein [Bacteroidia bacterium]|nr:DUF3868 domain-containing protein [Bacteroidia bacterium]
MRTKLYLLTILFCAAFMAHAQWESLTHAVVKNQSVIKQNDSLFVAMDIDISRMDISTQHMVVFTPVIESTDGRVERKLAPVVVSGRTRNNVIARTQMLYGTPVFETEPFAVVKRNNRGEQIITYTTSVPVGNWMKKARLVLRENITGCAECEIAQNSLSLADNILPEPFVPTYKLTYIMPEVERVKKRCETCVARLNYKVARAEILRDFGNNAQELALIDETVSEVKYNPDVVITDLVVSGYASPEGSFESNMHLSEKRANSLANYISARFDLARQKMEIKWYGEDWKGLEEAVKDSDIADKNAILDIINNVSNPDARDARLKQLSGGRTYKELLNTLYPPLRRNEYLINYEVRAFNVEEAKQLIKTKPQLLSLNEMYLVAETYPASSSEFKEVFDIAQRMFPDDAIAIMNVAAADIENGNNQNGINRLMTIETDPRAWNNIGVAYARMSELDKARTYFEKAAAQGDADAKANLEQLEKVLKDK